MFSISHAWEAVDFRLKIVDEQKHFNDRYPLMAPVKYALMIDTLKLRTLREWMRRLSSARYGEHLFDRVFPKSENPKEYHSCEGMIALDESPVQVLGWEEKDEWSG